MKVLLDGIAMVEKPSAIENVASISIRDHLGFGDDSNAALKYFKDQYDNDCIGEMNANNKLHGRGIRIWGDGGIHIGYWNDGDRAPGNYIKIYWDGKNFDVAECYLKEDTKRYRGTSYNVNGTTEKFEN